ncbi:MAG TPA: thioredoxin domain-containing protein [Pyrinomonadaceae bacterium]
MSAHKHTNRLADETSPYLLQHAHNPVDWYPWGDEAIEKARSENKPILLSIGYSACHWCHVMERESFEDEKIAGLMNEHFVNIKVDREERPDLDQIYMNAVQLMQRHGGWPLTVFLSPDLVPFFGGTYFPPEDRHGMPGFPRILSHLADAYRTRQSEIAEGAAELLDELRRMSMTRESDEPLTVSILDDAARAVAKTFDPRHGGFGGAPKFPAPMTLDFLLRTHRRTRDPHLLEIVTHTCRKMAFGGIYDQLGGGFHRYSTDAHWLVPHFEKMLYDNALLSRLYLHAYQATGDELFKRIVEETLDYVVREMTDPSGSFYSTQDADSEGIEGKFFVWDEAELKDLLGEDDARLFSTFYNVTDEGNFEEENILNVTRPAEAVAADAGVSVEKLDEVLRRGREVLFAARERRVKPGRDEKVLTAWNALMLEGFAEASATLGREDYRAVAERNAQFILENLKDGEHLLHVYKDGRAKHKGFLDDYAYFVSALVTLYETTGTLRWLQEATALCEKMIDEFWDEEEGGFFYAGRSGEQLIVRTKDFFDNATPAGNSVAADALVRLSLLTANEDYRRRATTIFRVTRDALTRHPSAFGQLLGALHFHISAPKEIAIISGSDTEAGESLLREVWGRYIPDKVVAQAREGDEESARIIPLLQERPALGGRATAYVCQNYSCRQPVTDARELALQLEEGAGADS